MRFKNIINNKKYLVVADQIVYSGLSFSATLVFARIMDITDFGILASIMILGFLLLNISNALVIQPMQIGLAKFNERKQYLSFNLVVTICISGAIILFGFLVDFTNFKHLIPSKINEKLPASTGLITALMIATWLTHDFLRKTFLACDEPKKAIVIDAILAVIFSFIVTLMFVFQNLSLSTAIKGYFLSYTLSSIVGIYILKLKKLQKSEVHKYLKYHKNTGSFLLFSALVQWWSSNLFVVASGIFLSIELLGAFRLVQSVFGVLNIGLQTVENYVIPKVNSLYKDSEEKASHYLRTLLKKGAIFFLLFAIPVFIFSSQIISLIGGPQYEQYHYLVKGMTLLYLVICYSYKVRIPIRVMEMNRAYLLGYALTFVCSLVYFKPLLSELSAVGAILGLILNQIILIVFWEISINTKNKSYENRTYRSW